MIALNGIAVGALLHFAGEEPDFADKVLRARVMTPGEMNIDRRIKRSPRLAPARDILGVALGIGSRELAPRIARARDKSRADRIGFDREAKCLDLRLRRFQFI